MDMGKIKKHVTPKEQLPAGVTSRVIYGDKKPQYKEPSFNFKVEGGRDKPK